MSCKGNNRHGSTFNFVASGLLPHASLLQMLPPERWCQVLLYMQREEGYWKRKGKDLAAFHVSKQPKRGGCFACQKAKSYGLRSSNFPCQQKKMWCALPAVMMRIKVFLIHLSPCSPLWVSVGHVQIDF